MSWPGADLNAQDEDGNTPAHISAEKAARVGGTTRLLRGLMTNGACPEIYNDEKKRPIDYINESTAEDDETLKKLKKFKEILENDDSDRAREKMTYWERYSPLRYIDCLTVMRSFQREEKSSVNVILFYLFMWIPFLILNLYILPLKEKQEVVENLEF